MQVSLSHKDQNYKADLSQPHDLSIPLGQARCFYAPAVTTTPYQSGDFIGSVNKGAPVNFYDVQLNPHGNGTHTESLGHITKKQESVNKALKQFHFVARLVTVDLKDKGKSDKVITYSALKAACQDDLPTALIIRTRPNNKSKLNNDYSGTNPPYLDKTAMKYIVKHDVKHLLIDLPSVDREVDKGLLAAHHLFWNVTADKASKESRKDSTITELIYVEDKIKDGLYLLNLQLAPLELDAAPSRPVIYKLKKQK